MSSPAVMIAIVLAASGEAGASTTPSRGLVVVLSPGVEDDVTRNAMARIRGELAAAPFEVVSKSVDPSSDLMGQVETTGHDLSPVAAFAIVREESEGSRSVAVWVSNRITKTTTVHRVQVRAGDVDGAAAHLAIEAVELVRASLAGLWPRPAPPVEVAVDARDADPAVERARLGLAIGVGTLVDLGTAPLFVAPAVAVTYGRPDRWGVGLRVLGLGPGAGVTAADGSGARMQRAAAALGLIRLYRHDRTLRPMLSVGLGAQYLGAEGTATTADREHALTAWSALLTAGGGLAVMLGQHLALTAQAEIFFAWPSVVVRVGQTDAARFNRPSLFTHGGLLATF